MNTRILMTTSSLVLGLAGLFGLFAPDTVVALLGLPPAAPLSVMVQLLGTGYYALAFLNWMARGSTIGGIYARPISMANLVHFLCGSLVLGKYLLSNGVSLPGAVVLALYVTFTASFYWLAFRAGGIPSQHTG